MAGMLTLHEARVIGWLIQKKITTPDQYPLSLYALVGDARQYRNGRELAVALGLTPRQHSSGGKERRLGTSKRGDKSVRTLLIHGARSALPTAPGKTDRPSRWVLALAERSHPNVAATALANKMARVAWAMLRHGTDYEPERVVA